MALEKSDVQGSGGSTQPLALLRLQHGRELFEHIAVVLVEPGNLAAGEHLGFDGLGCSKPFKSVFSMGILLTP